ncbi:flagellar biosynthetic protein FliO [Shinella pollutisoli]|uniref:Flagellar biosynthetic protein FliO n=1 Tax=Shinella pollutisoli TaxID=2250594 RepID=A0ABV7DE49_9HYPH|nr:flagellar biosynthetic protein FliO [Shinella pollutisoli]
MFEDILAENGTKFIVAAIVVLLGLACLALVLWIVRGRPSSPFIRGGRNRTPRLAVLDAAAIDTRRRLVLVRRDDVEHLVMIGGPTDIVIESRIVGAQAAEAPQAAAKAEPVARAEPVAARAEETPAAARSAAAAVAAERRPAATPDGVSAMGKVLYAAEDDAAARATAMRGAAQPAATIRQTEAVRQAEAVRPVAETPQRMPERRAEAMLDQARQRVLATPQANLAQANLAQANLSQANPAAAAQRPANPVPAARPAANAADNPAVVSEFEKLLEAEMTSAAATGTVRAAPQAVQTAGQAVPLTATGQPATKTREEAEAEMARLLGEIAANRKG